MCRINSKFQKLRAPQRRWRWSISISDRANCQNFRKKKAYRTLESDTPDRSSKRVSTDDLVRYVQKRGLHCRWGRVSPNPTRLVEQIKYFTETQKLPLIVCQQWHKNTSFGHYRVLIGIDGNEVVFHDPEPEFGGPKRRLPLSEFINQWRRSEGGNVTGGVAIWVAKNEIKSLLDPDLPNLWAA